MKKPWCRPDEGGVVDLDELNDFGGIGGGRWEKFVLCWECPFIANWNKLILKDSCRKHIKTLMCKTVDLIYQIKSWTSQL